MIRTDDPRLSAYALGELPTDAAVEVERLLEGDPEAIAAVEDLRAMAGTLAAAFGAEPAVALTEIQRAAVVEAGVAASVAASPRRGRIVRPWLPWTVAAAAAAAGLLAVLGPVTPRGDVRSSPAASGESASVEVLNRVAHVADYDVEIAQAGNIANPIGKDGSKAEIHEFRSFKVAGRSAPSSDPPGAPGTPVSPPKPGAGAYFNDGRDGDSRGRTENIFEGPQGINEHLRGLNEQLRIAQPAHTRDVAQLARESQDATAKLQAARVGLSTAPNLLARPHDAPPGLTEPTDPTPPPGYVERNRLTAEAYAAAAESPFLRPTDAPLSTFSIDVDTASYANVRRMITAGIRPPPDAVRLEELVNYFPYAYPAPTGTDPFAVHLETAACPWNLEHRLVRVALKGREIVRKERPASNLVFLVDVSGSMDAPAKLPLVKASLRMLVDELNERDSVAIVVYAGASGVALQPTTCEKKDTIREAIDRLTPGGSTNGAAGIELAYRLAAERFVAGGVNRVILATDGDFNVGVTSHDDLLKLIEAKAKSRIFLTTLGYGMGNLKDSTLEMLADKGNGTYGYVDTTREAHKLLVEEAGGTLVTIAKDVKVQVEFNPRTVGAYRLVGYDNRLLAARDFADDTKDAGEIGAGHTVTAFYEVVPAGKPLPKPEVDPLRYQPVVPPAGPAGTTSDELLTVKLRWKAPEGDVSTLREIPYTDTGAPYEKASADFRFAASVASFALLLRGSPHRGTGTYEAVLELAGAAIGDDPGGWRKEFVEIVGRAKTQFGEPAPAATKAPPAAPAPPASPPTAPADGPVAPPR